MKIEKGQNIGVDIVKRLTNQGFKAFFVGGAVRDMFIKTILNKQTHTYLANRDSHYYEPSDFDIVTDAPLEEIKKIFSDKKVKKVGKTFAICMVNRVEVASCRSDLTDSSQTNQDFPKCDLAQRDITINSMAFDPLTNEIIDPFNGKDDLENRVIRFTGDPQKRICEDPLRMVRVCRFVSMIQGEIEPTTASSIIKNRELIIKEVAPERIRIEILKAMSHKKPSLFFRALHRLQLLELIFTSLSRCFDLDGGLHHGETVFEHCLLTGDEISSKNPILRLAGYLHDAGKYDASEIKDGHLTFADHEKMVQAIICDLERLRFSSDEIKFIDAVIKTHMRPLTAESTPKAVRRLLAFLKEHDVQWQTFMQMRIADKSANLAKAPYSREDIRVRVKKICQELQIGKNKSKKSLVPLSVKELAISGHDVMKILKIEPSPEVGKVMNYLFESVLDEPSLNYFNRLKELTIQYGFKKGDI
ncbi:MAG: CCA tRNA nucleotidyltransferase [Desulfamplus sp.]|nr:CCA tRNA nucleotidyltransferase [Desulfamplus sp.]MBF0390600.1 CCA tRNA nucleotidyltransferase [Desulfamplus sp.]